MDVRKYLKTHIFIKGLVSRTYKEFAKLNNEINKPIKKGGQNI